MRVASAVLALAYGLAFFAVCLGACLAPTDEHACCPKGPGFTIADAASADCCHVTSGVSNNVTTGTAHAPAFARWIPQSPSSPRPPVFAVVPAASSPPLVLRI